MFLAKLLFEEEVYFHFEVVEHVPVRLTRCLLLQRRKLLLHILEPLV